MEKRLCKKCGQEKAADEFYANNKATCRACRLAYQKERYRDRAKIQATPKQSCIGCGVIMRKPESLICPKCALKPGEFGIKTASDYHLPKDDVVVRQLTFLHACGNGVLKAFLDKCFTATDAFIEELSREPMTHVNDVDPNAIEKYEDHESNWYQNTVLKSPRTIYRKGK